jgi:hypothetical protein
MRKISLKVIISILIICISIYIIHLFVKTNNYEPFTPKINGLYRPHIRNFNQIYETFINNYGPDVILTKLKKWNIY